MKGYSVCIRSQTQNQYINSYVSANVRSVCFNCFNKRMVRMQLSPYNTVEKKSTGNQKLFCLFALNTQITAKQNGKFKPLRKQNDFRHLCCMSTKKWFSWSGGWGEGDRRKVWRSASVHGKSPKTQAMRRGDSESNPPLHDLEMCTAFLVGNALPNQPFFCSLGVFFLALQK